MKSYLDLIPLSARMHRKQTRMTRLCIILAVFLVASIFGMADMYLRCQRYQCIQNDGAWHACFRGLDEEQTALLAARPEVTAASRYAVTNYSVDQGYTVNGKEAALCGLDESFFTLYPAMDLIEGRFPMTTGEVVATESLRRLSGVQLGDTITLDTPHGSYPLTVCGFIGDTSMLVKRDVYGLLFDFSSYQQLFAASTQSQNYVVYVQFTPWCPIQKTISSICTSFHLDPESVGQNAKLLGLMLQSNDNYILSLYVTALVLSVLVAAAGILMISSSLHTNIAQRIQFFGMLRCLGATRRQVIRFVRLEALYWCRTAIPAGLALSIATVWVLCALLKYLSPTYFAGMPAVGISWIGLAAGILIGLLTVLLSVRAPAHKASAVSPLTAVSGNASSLPPVRRAANTRAFSIEAALGIHHATGSKRHFLLMTASFAFSIILFLSFSPLIDFTHHAVVPLRPYTPDLSIVSLDNTCSVPEELLQKLQALPTVKRVYGRRFAYDLSAELDGQPITLHLISYEENQFGWAADSLTEGNLEDARNGAGVLFVANESCPTSPGSTLTLHLPGGNQTVPVSGILSSSPFQRQEGIETVICSESLFEQLTGQSDYTILDIQLETGVTDAQVEEIRALAGENVVFSDQRMSNSEVRGTYYSFVLFLYGFLAIISLISILNIINTISMSVSARLAQYSAMRAIGMSFSQLIRMIACEAASYVLCGVILGSGIGLALHYKIYSALILSRWGGSWEFPLGALGVILLIVLLSFFLALRAPLQQLRQLSLVDPLRAQ